MIIVLFIIVIFSSLVSAQTFKELQEIPKDSINVETMKIWIPVESDICQVKVKILDKDNNLIRELLDRRVSNGYYNIYWDKKDDSGRFVEAGEYNVALISCSYRKMTQIVVDYQKNENAADIYLAKQGNPPSLHLILHEDSVSVSVSIVTKNESHLLDIVKDTIVTKGTNPEFVWSPEQEVSTGFYKYAVTVNDYTHLLKFKYVQKAIKK